jgi:hypothetical protein
MKNVSKEQAERIFRSCDTSGDNKISLEEFRTMLDKTEPAPQSSKWNSIALQNFVNNLYISSSMPLCACRVLSSPVHTTPKKENHQQLPSHRKKHKNWE